MSVRKQPRKRAVSGDEWASPVVTVVLAEHHHLLREGVRCLLETEKDFKVVGEVADGLKVVRLVQRLKPRVLIMAMAMPALNSFEVTSPGSSNCYARSGGSWPEIAT